MIDAKYALEIKLAKLNKLNPLDILRLGYAKIEQSGKTVTSANKIDEKADILISFADGQVVTKFKERK